MSEMHELIIDSTTKIFKDVCTKELTDKVEEGNWPQALWNILAESEITSIGVPESLGGSGDYSDAFHTLRLVGKFAAPIPLAETLIVNWLLAKQDVKPRNYPVSLAVESPKELNIEKTEKGYRLTGRLTNIPWARYVTEILAFIRIEGETAVMLLPLEQAEIYQNNNLAGEPTDDVDFRDILIKESKVFAVEETEFLEDVMNLGGLAKAVMISGAMESILELSIQYSKEREQFGRPLHRLQAIQQHLAILAGETVAVVTSTNQAIDAINRGTLNNEAANAKIQANQAITIVTEIAHQIHGAIGATHEHRLHQLTRRLWAWREEFGNENYWAGVLAGQLMNKKGQSLWEMITNESQKEVII